MRVALFGAGGEIPVHALRVLRDHCAVAAVVRPAPSPGVGSALRAVARRIKRGRTPSDDLTKLASDLGVPEWRMRGRDDPTIGERMRAEGIELACIATFPWPLRADVFAAPRLGTVNVHASLLPRHRGPNPWFWTYHADDREVGVTVHTCEPQVDRGAVLAQSRWALPRGHPVAALHREAAERGAALLPDVIARAARGALLAVAQDEAAATRAPGVRPGIPMLDARWPVERTWHFLAGLVGQYREPLVCAGREVRYHSVPGFEQDTPRGAPGTVEAERARGAWTLWCADGGVRLEGDAA